MNYGWIDKLRDSVDIVDVVGDYVSLKPKGHRHWACCPFHNEKTPSFEVDSRSQMYYCFGCHKGGNVFNFVMEMEHMEFMDAARLLAERVGFEIPALSDWEGPTITSQQRQRVYELNRAAALYYHQLLYREEGAQALGYLHRRGLDDQTIRRFGLGATPLAGDELVREMQRQGYTRDELTMAGLCGERDGRLYDQFRSRVMFPIINPQGRVMGFGGRVMGDGQPKYLNTSDTIVFNKRRELFGLNIVKKQGKCERLILVEGYMDVVSLVQKGVTGVVATLGTALTPEQVALIKRYVPRVVVAYDGDGAGQKAIARALDMFEEQELPARVLKFPGGQDPDEYVREHGREAFDALEALAPTRWQLERLEESLDLGTQEGRTQYAIEAAKHVARLKNPVERESFLPELMVKTGFSKEALVSQMGVTPAQDAQPRRAARRREIGRDEFEPDYLKAEKLLLMLFAQGLCPAEMLKADDFSDELNRSIAVMLLDGKRPSAILDGLDEGQRDRAAGIFQQAVPLSRDSAGQMAADCVEKIRVKRLDEQIDGIKARLAEAQGDAKGELLAHLMKLTREKTMIRSGRKEWTD
ncbi:MAG: DNA primase [Candidatus Fimadaptatus sp.]